MLCLAACVLFLVNFLISEHFFVMIVQVSPLLLLSVGCLQVEARPVKGNLLLPSVPSCHLLSCIPFFVIILLLPPVPLRFLFILSSNPEKANKVWSTGRNWQQPESGLTSWSHSLGKLEVQNWSQNRPQNILYQIGPNPPLSFREPEAPLFWQLCEYTSNSCRFVKVLLN